MQDAISEMIEREKRSAEKMKRRDNISEMLDAISENICADILLAQEAHIEILQEILRRMREKDFNDRAQELLIEFLKKSCEELKK